MTVNPSPTGTNGQYSPAAVASALASVQGLVQAEVTKGNVPASLAADAVSLLQAQMAAPLAQQGVQQSIAIFQSLLPSAVAGAARRALARAASGVAPPGSTATDPLGLGPDAGWPTVPAGGPGGVGYAGSGSGQAPWPAVAAGAGGNGLSADPGLRQSFVGAARGSFFDASLPPPSGQSASAAAPQGRALPTGSTGTTAAGSGTAAAAAASGGGSAVEVLPGELSAYFNPGPRPADDETFVVAEWIGTGQNPFMLRSQLGYAKALHRGVIVPCARYYKQIIYGDPDYPVRLGQILYGIISLAEVAAIGGAVNDRHVLGQAVNFGIAGVPPSRICDDIEGGNIGVSIGTYADVNGVFASLPYVINGMEIRRMRLRASGQVPGAIDYSFGGGQ